jgi:DHA2 family multidrug resistance protein
MSATVPALPAIATRRPAVNPWVIALTVTLATFMEVLDTSIANVSLGHIAGSLSASHEESTWALTSYLVANAIVLPMSGWLSGLMGRKRFYMTCVFLFTVSSALCGMATSLGQLVFFRVLQGAGGGGLQPSEQGILLDTFPAHKRGMAMAVYGMAILVAPIMGPTLGGWITDNYSWRWIFYINIPVGCVSLVLSGWLVEDPPYLKAERAARRGRPRRIDAFGLGLIALGLGALEIVYDRGQTEDWLGSPFIVRLIVIAVICLVAAVAWELWHPEPIVNLRLLKDRNFRYSSLVIYCVFAVLYGSTVALPQMLQTLFGYSATRAGLVLSPGGLVTMAVMPVVGILLGKRVDARWLIMGGLAFLGAGSLWMSTLNLGVSPGQVIVPRCIQVTGMGMIFAPINTAAYMYLPREQSNNATGLFNLIRNEGSSLGVAVVNTLLVRRSQFHRSRLVEHIHPLNPLADEVLGGMSRMAEAGGYDPVTARHMGFGMLDRLVQQHSLALSYFDLFWVFGVAALASIPLVLLMRRSVAEKGAVAVH